MYVCMYVCYVCLYMCVCVFFTVLSIRTSIKLMFSGVFTRFSRAEMFVNGAFFSTRLLFFVSNFGHFV